MDLYSILACPVCKGALERQEVVLLCAQCSRSYPIVNGTPVLLPDGSVPATLYQHDLVIREAYDPWIPRVVMKSLPASAIILDLGAGNASLDLPNVIRMDVTLTPYVDVVGDAHALPFRPGVFDFIFSHAVIEHLRQPFLAAEEMFNALRNGGYVYGECNFVFAYHSFPYHYFNASQQGLLEVFSQYETFRCGVAPYQMPSFAIDSFFSTYLRHMSPSDDPEVREYRRVLQQILDQPLKKYDLLFTEEAALNVAAGVFYFGRKAVDGPSEVIPSPVQARWQQDPELQRQFPNLFNLGTAQNILLWAKGEGRQTDPEIEACLRDLAPFRKNETVTDDGQKIFDALPLIEPIFHTVLDPRPGTLLPLVSPAPQSPPPASPQHDELALQRQEVLALRRQVETLTATLQAKNKHILRLESLIRRIEAGRVMRVLRLFSPKKQRAR